MAERPAKRQRPISSENDDDDSEGSDGDSWMPEEVKKRTNARQERVQPAREMPRQRRNVVSSSSPEPAKRSIRLNVRAPPSRLREVTNEYEISNPPRERERLSRSSKNKQPIVDESSGSGETDEPEGFVPQDSGDGGEEDSEEEEEDYEDPDPDDPGTDLEDEDDEEDEDTDMPDAPPPPKVPAPKIRISAPSSGAVRKPTPTQMLQARGSKLKSVEEKEMEGTGESTVPSSDDEELSEPNSRLDEEGENDEEEDGSDDEEDEDEDDKEQEDDDEEDEDEEEEEDEEDEEEEEEKVPGTLPPGAVPKGDLDSSSSTPSSPSASGDGGGGDTGLHSRSATPDLSKLTRRQRAQLDAGGDPDGGLMALSNEAQKKKFFTAEQITMRRAEMARRRKDLSEKRNEEEKADTLKRLLEKPAHPKRRSKAQMAADAEREEFGLGTPGREEEEWEKANKLFVRTVISAEGTRVGVPEEWIGTPVGRVFEGRKPGRSKGLPPGKMVEVVE